jgi:hypothetical protein
MRHHPSVRRLYVVVAAIGLSLAISVHTTGCSLIGLTGGAIIDARTPRNRLVPTGKIHAFSRGDSLRLYLADSSEVAGRYVGSERMSDSRYRDRFARMQERSGAADLPTPGATVQVIQPGMGLVGGGSSELLAFLHDGIEVSDRRGRVRVVPFRKIHEIHWDGKRLKHKDLAALRLAGAVPLPEQMILEADTGAVVVPLDDIEMVWGPSLRGAARRGFVLGLAADAVVVVTVVAIAASSQPFSGGTSCDASPGLYSARTNHGAEPARAFGATPRRGAS